MLKLELFLRRMVRQELGLVQLMLLPVLRQSLENQVHCNLTKERLLYMLIVVQLQHQCLRGGEELSTELSVALQRCLLGGKSGSGSGIDPSSLVIVEGKVCWDLYIDGLVISSDGNLLDALGAAIKAALSNTGIPKVNVASETSGDEQPEVNISDEEFLQFDTSGIPVIVTLTKVGRHYIVDATSEEESQISSAISISINRKGHICGLTKRGGAGLDPSIILDMISVAKHVSEQLINKLDSEIAAAEANEEES
ncbi:3\'-5\'-exoribonuclease family protein isoform 4 [Theobroma cacao]|uniref:Ribosomal RNA-processing protein 42 n=1 Tax=Theobroma cacao TaxID=3641 RepID=A0A061FN86_THECC|nr:3\'-5\'-exoribonuclease family protein isoform 4 [Theobroma cacao]